jgi:hypothetical protein
MHSTRSRAGACRFTSRPISPNIIYEHALFADLKAEIYAWVPSTTTDERKPNQRGDSSTGRASARAVQTQRLWDLGEDVRESDRMISETGSAW